MQSSLCFTGQQEPKPEWMSAGTAQLICWAGPSLELLRDTEACGCKDAEVWIAAYLKNLGREILHLHKKLFAVFGIYRCPRRDLLLCLCRKMFPVAFQTSIIMLCVALGKPWSRMMASLEPALGDFSQPCFVCRGGWDQEGDSSVTVQWLSSKCHGVLGLEFVGGLWHLCCSSLSCWGLCWPKPAPGGSAVQPCWARDCSCVLISPKVSALKTEIAEVSCRHTFGRCIDSVIMNLIFWSEIC